MVEAVETKEDNNFDCTKVPAYKKKIEKLKSTIKNKKATADAFVAEVEELEDKKKKDHYDRLNISIDVIVNQYDLSMICI